jgi:hypothetical protein
MTSHSHPLLSRIVDIVWSAFLAAMILLGVRAGGVVGAHYGDRGFIGASALFAIACAVTIPLIRRRELRHYLELNIALCATFFIFALDFADKALQFLPR